MADSIRRLPDAELDVMNALWQCTPPVTRTEIEKRLEKRHPMAATTLLTLLARLAQKGFISSQRQDRSNVYTPLVARDEYLAAQSRSFVEKLCGGDIGVFAAALCSSGLSEEELEKLRSLLENGGL